jgi:acyl carrier protein phosphodiesterase
MNFLAHLYLSDDTPESRLGNLLGDFVRSPQIDTYPAPVRAGFALHQRIDAYTDAHPVFQHSRTRISLPRRRYAGVLVDVFYDHFLALHWAEFAPIPLPDFARQVYAELAANDPLLPESLRQIVPAMIRDDWLTSYRAPDGIDRALDRIARRLRHETPLAGAVEELTGHYDGLQADFLAFFPALRQYVAGECEG